MIDKIAPDLTAALSGVADGSTIMVGGFGSVGQPNAPIEALIEQGARELTVIANSAGTGHTGLARLMEAGRVRRIICSYPRSSGSVVFEALFKAGQIELEIVPQGTLAERIRAAGAGIGAFYTRPATGHSSRKAGKRARSTAGTMCSSLPCLPTWR